MNSKKEENIMLVVMALIATPNMLIFIAKSFRKADTLNTVFGYIMVALLIGFWASVIVPIIRDKVGKKDKENKYNKNEK